MKISRSAFFVLLFCEFTLWVNSQNLVVNPSFEDTIACPIIIDPKLKCSPWFVPSSGSPDYWHDSLGLTNCTGTFGFFGYQVSNSGNAYTGLVVSENGGASFDFREYLEGFLNDTLEAKHTYCVSFYLNLANVSELAANSIGAYFSNDSIVDYATATMLPYIPQVQNTGGVITDTLNWVMVSGSFEAQGGERFITIGNFYADSNTTVVPVSGGWEPAAYYYIDDVSVVDCTVGLNSPLTHKGGVSVRPNPATDEITINGTNNEKVAIAIYDQMGKAVYVKENTLLNTRCDITRLTKGVYYLVVSNTTLQQTVKVVKL